MLNVIFSWLKSHPRKKIFLKFFQSGTLRQNVWAIYPCLFKILLPVTHMKHIHTQQLDGFIFMLYQIIQTALHGSKLTATKGRISNHTMYLSLRPVFFCISGLHLCHLPVVPQQTINSITYGIMNNNFRTEYKRVFHFVVSSVVSTSENSLTDKQEMSNRDSMARK